MAVGRICRSQKKLPQLIAKAKMDISRKAVS